ncbi:hypothetical protein [Streptomyces sp. NPDC001774]
MPLLHLVFPATQYQQIFHRRLDVGQQRECDGSQTRLGQMLDSYSHVMDREVLVQRLLDVPGFRRSLVA